MLRPIKTFLNYIQKNANGATIFGVTSEMSEAVSNDTNASDSTVEQLLKCPEESDESEKTADMNQSAESVEIAELKTPVSETDQSLNIIELKPSVSDSNQSLETYDIPEKGDVANNLSDLEVRNIEVEPINELIAIPEENDLLIDQNNLVDDPLADPLAIEEFVIDINNEGVSAACGLMNTPDADILIGEDKILCYIDVEAIKEDPPIIDGIVCAETELKENKACLLNNPDLSAITEEQEARSDGSDSGLGSEISALQSSLSCTNTSLSVTDCSIAKMIPARSNLKRRSDVLDIPEITKKPKRSLQFRGVTVFYFPRMQGFACVPSQGGCTLGMGARHIHSKTFTMAEHAAEQRRAHKQQLQEINPRGSSSDESDSEEEVSEASGSDLDADTNGFLQPVPQRQRRVLLKAAGIRKIDTNEKDECREIRGSREFCGCNCRGYCDPETCSCSQSGIKCQVDRPSFPCGCTRDGCANVVGRVEFNPGRVRTHYIHTLMRLDLENKEKQRLDQVDLALSSGGSLLTYNNNCSSNNSNLSITTANISSRNIDNISSISNYSLVNSSHLSDAYGTYNMSPGIHNHHQSHENTFSSHSNIYTSTAMHNGGGISHLNDPTCLNTPDVISSHQIEPYNFRDVSDPFTIPSTQTNSNDTMIDFNTTSGQLYHETFNPSYVHHTFQNTDSNFDMLNSTVTAANYSSYQESFLNFASTPTSAAVGQINGLESSTNDIKSAYIDLNDTRAHISKVLSNNGIDDSMVATNIPPISEMQHYRIPETELKSADSSLLDISASSCSEVNASICTVDATVGSEWSRHENLNNSLSNISSSCFNVNLDSISLCETTTTEQTPSTSDKHVGLITNATEDQQLLVERERTDPIDDNEENLSDIIKKSIVEIVSA